MILSSKVFSLLSSFALSVSFSFAVPKALSPVLTQRCAPCHGPDLNGVGGVFPSLMTSELVKSGNMDGVIKFITYGSPADSKSLVKMPAKGGHLDLLDEEIRNITKQVITLAKGYVEEEPSKMLPREGYFKERFGPVVSTAVETTPIISWPPTEDDSDRLKRLYKMEKKLLTQIRKEGGDDYASMGWEELLKLKISDISRPGDPVEGTSTNFPKNENK